MQDFRMEKQNRPGVINTMPPDFAYQSFGLLAFIGYEADDSHELALIRHIHNDYNDQKAGHFRF